MQPTQFSARLVLATLFACLPAVAMAQAATAAKWQASKTENGTRYLSYSSTSPQLGKPTPHTVTFSCNPVSTKTEKGMLGIEVQLDDVASLKAFQFDAFEGPDATTNGKKLLRISVVRPNTPPFTVDSLLSGWTPDTNKFAFGTAQESQRAKSTEKTVLQALATDAESVQITITDPRNSKLKLDFIVPVSGQRDAFKTLLSGLK